MESRTSRITPSSRQRPRTWHRATGFWHGHSTYSTRPTRRTANESGPGLCTTILGRHSHDLNALTFMRQTNTVGKRWEVTLKRQATKEALRRLLLTIR